MQQEPEPVPVGFVHARRPDHDTPSLDPASKAAAIAAAQARRMAHAEMIAAHKPSAGAKDIVIDRIHAQLDALECSRPAIDDDAAVAASLGLRLSANGDIQYPQDFTPPVLSCGLIAVPHGKTESNLRHLFQDHSDSDLSQLLPEGVAMARGGAEDFVAQYADQLRDTNIHWRFLRSPLTRTSTTADQYIEALQQAGISVQVEVDPHVIEISHGSWAGFTVNQLAEHGREHEAEQAKAYRDGSFVAQALDRTGESKLDVLKRASDWLHQLSEQHIGRNTNVVMFGHGTFQNCLELLLRCYPERTAIDIFSRNVTGSSHLRRGEAHTLAPLHDHRRE